MGCKLILQAQGSVLIILCHDFPFNTGNLKMVPVYPHLAAKVLRLLGSCQSTTAYPLRRIRPISPFSRQKNRVAKGPACVTGAPDTDRHQFPGCCLLL